ncbi:MAG: HNH endonuclease [Gammaproteobacteria bacterium]
MPPPSQTAPLTHHHETISLRNHTCIYCGCARTPKRPFTREHVIGRRFVPADSLKGQWNLIANACRPCNGAKADLEDDISAILLQETGSDDARRKADGAVSRHTGKRVRDSHERLSIGGRFGAATMSFGFVAPPQLAGERVDRLAWFHVQAFIYLQTYDAALRQGRFIEDAIAVESARAADWGNERFTWFQALTTAWSTTLHAIGASGFFKLVFRACPEDDAVRSFALEWNTQKRIVGFMGPTANIERLAAQAPQLKFRQATPHQRYRREITLAEADDHLFDA